MDTIDIIFTMFVGSDKNWIRAREFSSLPGFGLETAGGRGALHENLHSTMKLAPAF